MNQLKIIFFGTPHFAVASLSALQNAGKHIVAVVTAPDQPSGRGLKLNQSPVKEFALSKNIPVLQPLKLKDPAFLQTIKNYNADLFIVVAFRMMPETLWSMPPKGTFNLHGSLLPQYRGAAPIHRAVINGETQTGVTTFFLKHEIDTGAIIFSETIKIEPTDTTGTVHDKLMQIGGELIVKTVNAIEQNNITTIEQNKLITDARNLKHAPKIFKEDCLINWNNTVQHNYNHIRGLSPHPAAFTYLTNTEGKTLQLKIFFATKEDAAQPTQPGIITTDQNSYIKISCNNGWLSLTDIQLQGKKRMPITDFLRGFKINNYTVKK
jgi:methionyl-tRNA formyltransferase